MNLTHNNIRLKSPRKKLEWDGYHSIRRRVLFEDRNLYGVYDPLHLDEHRRDNNPKILINEQNVIVGVIRIDLRSQKAFFRRVAIDFPFQRQQYGTALIELSENFSKLEGVTAIEVSVAESAVPFYLKCGYELFGEIVGDSIPMRKNILA